MSLTADTLKQALWACGLKTGGVAYVTGNLGRVGLVNGAKDRKTATMELYREVLLDVLGEDGTLVFPTHSWSVLRDNQVFDLESTPSDYALSEFLRTSLPASRSPHPLASIAAYGRLAKSITAPPNTHTPYGYLSSFDALTQHNAVHLSIGIPARKSISAVHHCEAMAGVPYRYMKEFILPVRQENITVDKAYYLYVTYLEADLERDKNQKLFSIPKIASALKSSHLGRGIVEGMPLEHFVPTAIMAMLENPYIWLSTAPRKRPWQR